MGVWAAVETERDWIRERIERLRRVARGIGDDKALAAIQSLIEESEARLRAIEASTKTPR